MARSKFSFKKFLQPISGEVLTARQLEKKVVKLFNDNLAMFAPGIGPGSILEDCLRFGYIRACECKTRFIVK